MAAATLWNRPHRSTTNAHRRLRSAAVPKCRRGWTARRSRWHGARCFKRKSSKCEARIRAMPGVHRPGEVTGAAHLWDRHQRHGERANRRNLFWWLCWKTAQVLPRMYCCPSCCETKASCLEAAMQTRWARRRRTRIYFEERTTVIRREEVPKHDQKERAHAGSTGMALHLCRNQTHRERWRTLFKRRGERVTAAAVAATAVANPTVRNLQLCRHNRRRVGATTVLLRHARRRKPPAATRVCAYLRPSSKG